MKKVLIVNGHDQYPFSKGDLTRYLTNRIATSLMNYECEVRVSEISLGYSVQQERNNIFWANVVILQFPVYWFTVPAGLKKYMDQVFEYGQFYGFNGAYGGGGLLKNKRYCLSSTWNAPESEFNNPSSFFEGKSQDDVLVSVHKAMQFCGLKNISNLSLHDVVKSPQSMNIDEKVGRFIEGLKHACR